MGRVRDNVSEEGRGVRCLSHLEHGQSEIGEGVGSGVPMRIEAAACLTACSYSAREGASMSVSSGFAPACGERHAEISDGVAVPSA